MNVQFRRGNNIAAVTGRLCMTMVIFDQIDSARDSDDG